MDLQYLKKLVRLVESSSVDSIEIEEEGTKIKISKGMVNHTMPFPQGYAPQMPVMAAPALQHQSVSPAASEQPVSSAAKSESKHHEVKSPIVGTFYRSPAPDADPYVEVGQTVQQGTVICIIEAMKLMNEIESDMAGRIVKINVENGQPVEYNQPLFLIEPL